MMGTALGGVAHGEQQYHNFLTQGPRAVDPSLALTVFAGAASCNIAIEFGCTGPNATNGMSCASGAIAIGEGFRAIARGEADVMIAGGAEAPLAPLCFGAFAIIRAMSTRNDDPEHASRPFDAGRDGFVMAEGSAVLVLEERGRALARGAPVYAEVCGYGLTNDAYHMTAPRPDGSQAARCIRNALAEARVSPGEVGYINAHGSSTPLNDPTETSSIKQVFADHAYRLALSGTKGYYGHALGASGAIEAAICALASRRGWFPPTVNLETPDPACDLDHVTGEGRRAGSRLPGEQLLRVRRDQRGAGVSEGGRLDSPPIRALTRRSLMPSLLRRSVAELLGTFALVFFGVGSVASKYFPEATYGILGIAVAHGLVLAVMVTALHGDLRRAPESGGHPRAPGRAPNRRCAAPAPTSWRSSSARCSRRC